MQKYLKFFFFKNLIIKFGVIYFSISKKIRILESIYKKT